MSRLALFDRLFLVLGVPPLRRRDEARITALTGDGIDELRDMLANARRSPKDWHNFLEDFVSDPRIIARVKEKDPR